MKLFLDSTDKQNISVLLKYYRKKSGFSQRDFILFQGESLCSYSTYNRIEQGVEIKSSDIYDKLLTRLGKKFCYNEEILASIEKDAVELHEHVVRYEPEKLAGPLERIQRLLDGMEGYLIESEYLWAVSLIVHFYNHLNLMEEEEFEKIRAVYPVFIPPIREILMDMCFKFVVKTRRNNDAVREIYEELMISESSDTLALLNTQDMHYYNGEYLYAYELSQKLETCMKETKNYNRLLDVYNTLVIICDTLQLKHAHLFQQKYEDTLRDYQDRIHKNKFLQNTYTCGVIAYDQHRYEDSYRYFHTVVTGDLRQLLPAALFMHRILILTGKSPEACILRDVLPDEEVHYSELHMSCYRYFQLKYSRASSEETEEFLCRKVMDYISRKNNILWPIFEPELLSLIRRTGHYYLKKKYQL